MPDIAEANRRALMAGYNYGETTEAFTAHYAVAKAKLPAGTYRSITGNQALAWGLMAAAERSSCELFLGLISDYAGQRYFARADAVQEFRRPHISGGRRNRRDDLGHRRRLWRRDGRDDLQRPGHRAEARSDRSGGNDRIAGADHQRAARRPKHWLADENRTGRFAASGLRPQRRMPRSSARRAQPGDCFEIVQEAWQIAVRYMTPVFVLTDGYLANGSEPWRIPDTTKLSPIEVEHPGPSVSGQQFMPYARNERLARPWALPGTPGLMHRVGGLEKQDITGNVNYEPENHQHMVNIRAAKVAGIVRDIPPLEVDGPQTGKAACAELGRNLWRLCHSGARMPKPRAARWRMLTFGI